MPEKKKYKKREYLTFGVAAGVKEDCEQLLETFKSTKSIRFDDFVQCWQDKKFSLIFTGRESIKEQMEFSEEALRIAKGYLMPPYTFHIRVGGLYLLYCLYFKQPIRYFAKIRVNLPDWREISKFIARITQEQHHDALFAFKTLQFKQAFLHTLTSAEMGPEFVRVQTNQHGTTIFSEKESGLKSYLEEGILDQLSSIHSKYYGMKVALSGPNSTHPETSLDTIFREIVPGLNKLVAEYETEIASLTPAQGDSTITAQSLMSKRKQIKEKAFGTAAAPVKSRRYRKAELHGQETSGDPHARLQYEAPQNYSADSGSQSEDDTQTWNQKMKYEKQLKGKKSKATKNKRLKESNKQSSTRDENSDINAKPTENDPIATSPEKEKPIANTTKNKSTKKQKAKGPLSKRKTKDTSNDKNTPVKEELPDID